jgi:hypothetical protein
MDPEDQRNLAALVAAGRSPPPWPPAPLQGDQESLADALIAYGAGARAPRSPDPQEMADALMAWRPRRGSPSPAPPPAPDPSSGDVDLGSNPLRVAPQGGVQLSPVVDTRLIQPNLPKQLRQATQAPVQPWQPDVPALQTRIDPIPGFPQTGDSAWRAQNDQIFLDAVNAYNIRHGLRPGDPGYWTADMLKAQAMRESGSDRDKAKFLSDPLQVNTPANWDDAKIKIAGLTGPDEPMTPEISAGAALEWLRRNGWHHDTSGAEDRYLGDSAALSNYKGRDKYADPKYAPKILGWASAAESARGETR